MNLEIVVADGATGKTKYKRPTPADAAQHAGTVQQIPANSGRRSLFLRSARYRARLRHHHQGPLQDHLGTRRPVADHSGPAQCVTGHYPYAYDVDGDGKDELMMGYTLFDHDGTKRWSLDDQIEDHADGVAIVRFRNGTSPRLLCAASDEGIFFADMRGNILKHHYLGHVQNPAIADFRPDLPGLESVSINFWGNQGIVHFFDADGELYHDFEPCQHGSMCLPINWTGQAR